MKTVFDIKIDFEKSQGSFVHDKKTGQKFLDLFSLYSSLPLGYNHPIFDESFHQIVRRVSPMRMANNMFKSDELETFVRDFRPHVFSDHLHLTCTGALAVESALKCAMFTKKVKDPMVLSLRRSFHGVNSWGFLTDLYANTAPRLEPFPRNSWKNLDPKEIQNYFNTQNLDNLVAVVIEPIQSTAGDFYVPKEDLLMLQDLCRKNDICFILDEIQTGFGVTGKMWYYEKLGLQPDILIFGKKSQICGIVANERYSSCMTVPQQMLEVTFDGDLIDAVRSCYILKAYEEGKLLERANQKSLVFREILSSHVDNYRSEGLLIAFDFAQPEKRNLFVKKCFENQILCNGTGEKSVRMRPNLAISENEIDVFATRVAKIWAMI